jgi:hypothetical protein
VRLIFKTKTGEVVAHTLSTVSLMQTVNMAVAAINTNPGRVLDDLGLF